MAVTCRAYISGTDPAYTAALFVGQLRVGNNDDTGGAWELAFNGSYGDYYWGVDGNGYLESGDVAVNLTVDNGTPSATAGWTVGGATTLPATAAGFNNIDRIGVRAECIKNIGDGSGVGGPLYMKWKNLDLTFYDANDNPTGYSVGTANLPTAQLIAGVATNVTLVILPGNANQVRIDISGTIELQSRDPNRKVPPNLAATQIASRVYVWKA